ncbi:MAG: hypothetical protein QY871_00030 [Dehalococcoides mccartyi]|uniref:hypothetical protein n=1 Tax=Dehalococcoides mccartyi TaxID=61435 RepID=UPI0025C7E13B|nr:hypothetical protein [Dehalococcoides mccartyi]MDN4185458.1 hypothetical protein [Dehalococcoides mccartyi]
MGRVPITIMGYKCERCGHEWIPRPDSIETKVCPKCKSPYWDIPKKGTAISYEEFCAQIKNILVTEKTPLTWTEIRTKAKLHQILPNNQWVHNMERDIELVRERDKNGVIRWRLGTSENNQC